MEWLAPSGRYEAFYTRELTDNQKALLREHCPGLVCEVGCGTGRIAKVFEPELYIGLDVNDEALAVARGECPDHRFELVDERYPEADTYLFANVLFHLPDAEARKALKKARGRVVIYENIGRRDSENFHRDAGDYAEMVGREADDVREISTKQLLIWFP